MPRRTAARRARRAWVSHAFRPPSSKPLLWAVDNGPAVRLDPLHFAPAQRDRDWRAFVDSFIRANEPALLRLDCRVEVAGGPDGAVVRVKPGGHTGAVPLRSAQTQAVVGGLVVVPRFERAGVGRVLQETGWVAAPEFLDLPLVPGSGREIPPWVLAGPVIGRPAELLRTAKRGYRDKVEELKRPRGRILWAEYTSKKMPAGRWDTLPCRYSDLATDPKLRRWIRRDSHRADMHQVLAYAALFDAPKITTTLVYPLRPTTSAALHARGRDVARAELFHGGRHLTLELQGLPFGSVQALAA